MSARNLRRAECDEHIRAPHGHQRSTHSTGERHGQSFDKELANESRRSGTEGGAGTPRRREPFMRASTRLATFAQAAARTSPTAPSRIHSERRTVRSLLRPAASRGRQPVVRRSRNARPRRVGRSRGAPRLAVSTDTPGFSLAVTRSRRRGTLFGRGGSGGDGTHTSSAIPEALRQRSDAALYGN
jgi:hypothetical protein